MTVPLADPRPLAPATGGVDASPAQLRRILGPFDGLSIVVGVVIGSGILGTPGLIAGYLGHPAWILAAWALGGVSVALTALVLAELGAMIPAAGGKYAFARAAYGDFAGCFAGWGEVLFNRTFTGAMKAVLIGQYAVMLAGGHGSPRLVAGLVALAFVLLHLRGVQAGRAFQNASTILKVVLLLGVVAAGFALGGGASWHASAAAPPTQGLMLGIALASQSVFLTYYGAEASLQMAGEVREPGRNVPRMLLVGIGLVAALYLLINAAMLNTLTPAAMAGSNLAARDVLARVVGDRAGMAVALVALGILLNSLNFNFFGTPRVPFALARDGLAPRALAGVSPRGTPTLSLLLCAGLILVLGVSGTFELLVRFMSFTTLAVDGFVLTSIFVLRRRMPDAIRPFRVPLYPWLPAAALVLYATVFTIIVVTQPKLAAGGLGLLAALAAGAWLTTRAKRVPAPAAVEA